MKKVGDLFADLGFRADASDSVKRAFVENLVRAANQQDRERASAVTARRAADLFEAATAAKPSDEPTKPEKVPRSSRDAKSSPQQLSFSFEDMPPTTQVKRSS